MPTAEELGAQFEQFLAEQQGRENPDTEAPACPAAAAVPAS